MLAAAVTLGAQQSPTRLPAYRGRILGVFDANTGEPIEGALVTDVVSKMSALTTKTGTVSLVFLPDSGSIVRVQKIGYQPATMVVRISPEDTLPITMLLTGTATTLPAVVTKDSAPKFLSPGLREFEERRKQGMGHYITEAQLRKNDSKRMTSIVRTLAGLNIVCPATGRRRSECWAVGTRRGCPLDVYINGVISIDNDLEKLAVSEYAAVEYYAGPATIPPEYNKTGSSCGVLLFWMRDR
jgi:hypothetical protein